MAKSKKLQRRPLRAASDRHPESEATERDEASRGHSAEPVSKLSVDLPESFHAALKTHCASQRIKIKDWLLQRIAEATGKRL